eukprot:Skav219102  [mRNA]  locus=scaffold1574:212493:213095:+ [translate_table: standard]
MACTDIRRFVSCVGFARRHAAKIQLPMVKEYLTKTLYLLTSKSNEIIPSVTPSSVKPSTPSMVSQMASLKTDLSAPLVTVVHQACAAAVSDAVSGLVGQLNALLAYSDSMSHRMAQVEQRLAYQEAALGLNKAMATTEGMLFGTLGSPSPTDPDIVRSNAHQQLMLGYTRCPSRKRHLEVEDAEIEQTAASSSRSSPEWE